ncbi:acyloxyacyl hydrolase [Litoribrevibacter euphylliae]|uniref:Acyloxyacyl hydrolase n=1 Tax=Litoribrevibacter euphylliae TaxID=1834034 RepID=A0ABV7HGV5_9GAMM
MRSGLMLLVWCLLISGACPPSLSAAEDNDYNATKLRLGVFAHNKGLISSRVEHGTDFNGEVVFSPINIFWDAEPTFGFMLNGIGNTSYLYSGVSWEIDLFEDADNSGLFIIPFLGLSVHNGKREPESKRRGLGCRVLFREAIEVGWRFSGSSNQWALSVLTDHLSHGGFCEDRNQGLDNTGIRFHWFY